MADSRIEFLEGQAPRAQVFFGLVVVPIVLFLFFLAAVVFAGNWHAGLIRLVILLCLLPILVQSIRVYKMTVLSISVKQRYWELETIPGSEVIRFADCDSIELKVSRLFGGLLVKISGEQGLKNLYIPMFGSWRAYTLPNALRRESVLEIARVFESPEYKGPITVNSTSNIANWKIFSPWRSK